MENAFSNFKIPERKKTSERAELVGEIYELYTHPKQKILRKKENWKRYIAYLKSNRIKDSKEAQKKFKKTKQFIKEKPISSIAYFLSPIKTKDLYYIISVGKDKNNRNENFSGWLLGHLLNK